MASRLDAILEVKQREILALKDSRAGRFSRRVRGPRRDFAAAIAQNGVRLIAEIKRRSPSCGELRGELDVEETARTFERHGAAAISVLTDRTFFGGSLDDLADARRVTRLPVLRKDFLVDEVQLEESKQAGADAVLLIVAVLGRRTGAFLERCQALDLDALVEVHDESELHLALAEGARLIGVNNRDLTRFEVDRSTAFRLKSLMPARCIAVAESGIASRNDVIALDEAGFDACLVGEALMRSSNPGAAIDALLGRLPVGQAP